MSRSKSLRYLLCTSLAVLPFLVACGAAPTRPASSPSDRDDSSEGGRVDDADGMDESSNDDGSKSGSDKSTDEDSKSDKQVEVDEDDDKAPVDDSRTTASVAAIFKENRKAFKKCYEDVRKEQPELKGNVIVKVVLDGAGKVKKAYVDEESSIRHQKIVDCMIKLAQSLTYPKSSKGLDKDFEYNFGFNNQ